MNKSRRTRLQEALNSLNRAHGIIEDVLDEEVDSFDNMPENLQGSDRYECMENAIGHLEEAASSISEAIDSVEEAQAC